VRTVDELHAWLSPATEKSPDENGDKDVPIVVIGGNRAGLALACVARSRGAEVVVLEAGNVFSAAIGLVGRWRHVHEAQQAGVQLVPNATLREISTHSVTWTDAAGDLQSARADRVFISNGAVPDTTLLDALKAKRVAAEAIGDCVSIGLVEGAMQRAAEVVLEL
jgi:thioredoxin reductase